MLLCGLLLLVAQSESLGAPAQGPPHRIASDLAASERLVTGLPPTNSLPGSAEVQGLIEWPSVETLALETAREDLKGDALLGLTI